MKKIMAIALVLAFCCSLMTGCKSQAERKLEEAREAAAQAAEWADQAEERFDTLEEMMSEIEYLQEEIASLTPDTAAYRNAVARNNQLIEELIEKYPELAPFVEEK